MKPKRLLPRLGAWPYPRWIAHRGGGTGAPENTMAAMRWGWLHGFDTFECDVKLSADGEPYLLHDDTLDRTTNGLGSAQPWRWAELLKLDAGSWHSPAFANEEVLHLADLTAWCIKLRGLLNIELKPLPGDAERTGRVVARATQALWAKECAPPILTSFDPAALAAARSVATDLPYGLLLDDLWAGWEATAKSLDVVLVVCEADLIDAAFMQVAQRNCWQVWAYTVNDLARAQRLFALGVVGLITDNMMLPKQTGGWR